MLFAKLITPVFGSISKPEGEAEKRPPVVKPEANEGTGFVTLEVHTGVE